MAFPLLAVAALAAGGLQAYGQYKSNKDASSASLYNARLYEQQAAQIGQARDLDLFRMGIAKRKALGNQRASYAKAGVTSEGTPLEVMADTAFNYELDSAITKYNYDIQASQAKSQSEQLKQQAKIYKRQSIISPLMTMFSTAAGVGASGGFSGGNQINSLKDTGGGRGTFIQTTSGGGYRA